MATTNEKKVAVLQKIREEKCILFAPFSSELTKKEKCEKWQEVSALAESLGLISGKTWQYVRDTLWCNWRKRTMAKRDNAKMTGTGGDKEAKYNEIDLLVLDILGKDNPTVEGLGNADCFQGEDCNDPEIQSDAVEPPATPSTSTLHVKEHKKSKRCRPITKDSPTNAAMESDEDKKRRKLDFQLEYFEIKKYKMRLEVLEIEKRLRLPRSKYTKDLPEEEVPADANVLIVSQDGLVLGENCTQNIANTLNF